MGNSNGRQSGASSPRHHSTSSSTTHPVRTFDGGSLSPHGIYPGRPDYNPTHVLKYIRERRLAPFYKGLDDYEDEWSDHQLSHFVKEGKLPPTPDSPSHVPSPVEIPRAQVYCYHPLSMNRRIYIRILHEFEECRLLNRINKPPFHHLRIPVSRLKISEVVREHRPLDHRLLSLPGENLLKQ